MPRINSVSRADVCDDNSPAGVLAKEWRQYVVAPDQMEIIPRGNPREMQCGVYVLWRGHQPLYIGSSRNVQNRIAQHTWAGRIPFDGYSVIDVEDERVLFMLEAIENAYIKALETPLNYRTKGLRMRNELEVVQAIKAAWDACLL